MSSTSNSTNSDPTASSSIPAPSINQSSNIDHVQKLPFWTRRLLSNTDSDHEIAYKLQVKGATQGAIRWAIYSTILCGIGHVYWPFFRKQTLAFKGFVISSATMSGMVIWADHYLLKHEKYLRKADDIMRRQARKELAERGLIATETELNKWKQEQLIKVKNNTFGQPNDSQ
ncbi:hypothetical protein O181_064744 [Austropuccinia psidii MF-1]|uniref:Uncharacterized protein n=1 Tax=Austropuccinia psidii MF-1 TaxID=1389203 RepID=A0A9Q3EPR1_9BASI|nr:hypothetical protein [Austropuccinia psidii MF-1]